MKKSGIFRVLFALILALLVGVTSASAAPWKFGVMSDTQWTCSSDPAGQNPNHVAVSIINQINSRFIDAGVKLVIQVGDLTENGADADIAVRAAAAQTLYDAGIGFFPMRGNHETYSSGNNYGIDAFKASFPQTQGNGANTLGAANFSSPSAVSSELAGLSYSFDYGTSGDTARFVVIDDWVTPSKLVSAAGYTYGYSVADQQGWISDRLSKTGRGTQHAFVFSHQNLIGENHQDSLFSGYTDANPEMQNVFFASLQNNDVKYYISGHDHIHQRSVVVSPDGLSRVQEQICASNSSKFYTPKALTDANWKGQKVRETSLSQERYTVGYYIYTVDGPKVTVDYYSDDHGNWASDNSYPATGFTNQVTPVFNFIKKETWGYSLNGKEALVAQGGAYALTDDTSKATANGETGYFGTTAKILSGTNGSTAKDYNNRAFTKTVNTGWSPRVAGTTLSDIFTLWGLGDLGASTTDTYALSLSYDPTTVTLDAIKAGHPAYLAVKDADGNWVKAASKSFVRGPYNAKYPLGFYGIDTTTNTVWAVVNSTGGDFAVIQP